MQIILAIDKVVGKTIVSHFNNGTTRILEPVWTFIPITKEHLGISATNSMSDDGQNNIKHETIFELINRHMLSLDDADAPLFLAEVVLIQTGKNSYIRYMDKTIFNCVELYLNTV